MKIVYFIDHLRGDGTQRVLVQLVEGLHTRAHKQSVVCLNDSWDESVVNDLRAAYAEVRFIGKTALASGVGFFSTYRWLEREKFDVAVSFLFNSDVFGRMLGRAARVPRIVTSLEARNIHYAWWQCWLIRRTMRWADAILIKGESMREFAITSEGADNSRVHIVPNGVNVQEYAHPVSRSELRAQFGLRSDHLVVGTVGRLTFQKGIDVLLRATALISAYDLDLVLMGEGESGVELRNLAIALGLESRVHFAGYRRDVPCLLGSLELYIQPSRWEGMPISVLEAMAAGCPIVATAIDGNRDLIEDGIHGWLVPSDDPMALARAIEAALSNPSEAQRRGSMARQRVAAEFSVERMVESWESVLKGFRVQPSTGELASQ